MRSFFTLVFITLMPGIALAQDASAPEEALQILPAEDHEIEQFLWKNRVIVVFADNDADPRFQEQMTRLTDDPKLLTDRDVIVLTDTNPADRSPARKKLRPRGFMMVLIGKDGVIHLRKPAPWRAREISRTIDKLPLRLQEERDRRAAEPLVTQ